MVSNIKGDFSMQTVKKLLVSFSAILLVGGISVNSPDASAKGKAKDTAKYLETKGGWKDGEPGYTAGCNISWALGIKDVCGEKKDSL